jgi:hypothetical protein
MSYMPYHDVDGTLAAAMQADFYSIQGYDYPVMVLTEFEADMGNPNTVDSSFVEMVYLIKDGEVTWEKTDEERAALFSEHEVSGMTYINGEHLISFPLGGTDVDASISRFNGLLDWLGNPSGLPSNFS